MKLIYQDGSILVCIKPAGVRSTDEPGGLPSLLRAALGSPEAEIRTVHRLDQVVSGLMVLARTEQAAGALSRQIREGQFGKEYQAVIHWRPPAAAGTLRDLLWRNLQERKTYVTKTPGKGVQEAVLDYETLASKGGLSLLRIWLRTGRTHQIRAQFAARGLPLVGDRKYSAFSDDCSIALWSARLTFAHPETGEKLDFAQRPPAEFPWTLFEEAGETFSEC